MPAQNLPGTSGPYRIDVVPQDPIFAALPTLPVPHTVAVNSPNTLVGDTSSVPQVQVRQGWPYAAPLERSAEIVEEDLIE